MIDDETQYPGPFLVVAPHPDDDVIGVGGFIAKAVAQGDRVKVIYLTSGELGAPGQPPPVVLEWRERDARRAAEHLGIEATEFWEQPDGALQNTAQLANDMAKAIDEFQPGAVLVTHPQESHPDHRAAWYIVRDALRQYVADGGRPVPIFEYEVWTPMGAYTAGIDITGYIDTKIAAIRLHESQVSRIKFDEAALALARFRGELHNRPHGIYAEMICAITEEAYVAQR